MHKHDSFGWRGESFSIYISNRPEVNIKPWQGLKEDLREGNERVKWMDREPYAYWRGNNKTGLSRVELIKCNVSDEHDWKARIFAVVRKETRRYFLLHLRAL